ncbi:MAG TPA: hypothetical protein VLH08_13990 [Acidobacteriota bacterium]|nr:hypothetical protein [Acidobacteriota bacterium]
MYQTQTLLQRKLRVRHRVKEGSRLVLRTELDWDKGVEPESITDNGEASIFNLECKRPFLYFKAVLKTGDQSRWAVEPNNLVLMTHQLRIEVCGWPGDNFEVTYAMAMALSQRGWVPGKEFLHVMFPLALHDEKSWGVRLHLPLQLFLSRTSVAFRRRRNV